MSKITKIAMRIVPVLAFVLVVAMVFSFAIPALATGDSGGSIGDVTLKGDDNVVFPPDVSTSAGPSDEGGAKSAVPDYHFGEVQITGTVIRVPNVGAASTVSSPVAPQPTYIRVRDIRGGNAGWELQAKMKPFTNSSDIIAGASIQIITSGTAAAQWSNAAYPGSLVGLTAGGSSPTALATPAAPFEVIPGTATVTSSAAHTAPTLPTGKLELIPGGLNTDGAAVSIARAASGGTQGLGEWWIPSRAILHIPVTAIKAQAYTAAITWTLLNAPI